MYADCTVIVAGAVEETATFADETLMNDWLKDIEDDAETSGYRIEVYVVWHDHDFDVEECACVQYLTDHHPTYVYNPEGNI